MLSSPIVSRAMLCILCSASVIIVVDKDDDVDDMALESSVARTGGGIDDVEGMDDGVPVMVDWNDDDGDLFLMLSFACLDFL